MNNNKFGARHVDTSQNLRKFGFTLAEILITLAVIGVVAAITMPMLIQNVRNHVRAKRIENIEQKFSKATDKMVALGVYTGLGSTENFVNELGKHLKLAKVCDNDNLQSCWPYEKVLTRVSTNTLWEISKTKEASELKMKDDDYSEWDKTMGIITADGTSMILSYNKKCDIDETKPINYGGAISSTTGCVAVVYDWNGATKPNKYGDDVLSINAKGLHNSCGAIELGNELCFTSPFEPKPMMYNDCEKEKKELGIKECCPECEKYGGDRWANAVKQCGGVDRLPSNSQLNEIASYIYSAEWKLIKKSGDIEKSYSILSERAANIGLPNPVNRFVLWSGQENERYNSGGLIYDRDGFGWHYNDGGRDSAHLAICIGD